MKDIHIDKLQETITQKTFIDYRNRLSLMAKAVFKWEGLPGLIDEKYIERYLFEDGRCMLFHDEEKGWMVTRCTAGGLNYYDEPTDLEPVANEYTPKQPKNYTPGVDCVLICNNDEMLPTDDTIILYAARMAEIQRTSDINIIAQKTPVIVTGTEKQRISLKALIKQWMGNEPLIFGDKQLDGVDLKTLNTAAPVVFDKLAIEKGRIWNECMTFLGINNANMDKRERLVDDEVQANNEQIELSADVMLKARQKAAREISKLCGCKVTVTMRKQPKPQQEAQEGAEGGAEE